MSKEVLDLFKAVVIDDNQAKKPYTDLYEFGIVLDFVPTSMQKSFLIDAFPSFSINTLFSVKERKYSDVQTLVIKQLLHYVEVYGLGAPGKFDLTVEKGKVLTMNLVTGITVQELQEKIDGLIYTNAPIKDTVAVKKIIKDFRLSYDVNKIQNNELKVILFDATKDAFNDGDDAVRWMCFTATESPMLIKSQDVIKAIKGKGFNKFFFEAHEVPLAQVFNRHKRLILAAKKKSNASVINKISRLSKTLHVPLHDAIAKSYVSKAIKGEVQADVLEKISVRDKFKFLNLLEYKKLKLDTDAFVIRNGKIHVEGNRATWKKKDIKRVEADILASLESDLGFLKNQKILLDDVVSYGLPTSRKQAMGQLPFGSKIKISGKEISSGIYWKNEWGATDLDLSTIDVSGQRTGWGQMSGYDGRNGVIYSGDMTYADPDAMEFMTSKKQTYGLFVSIFSGKTGCKAALVVGRGGKNKWMKDTVIKEEITLNSRGTLLGFVNDKDFIVYQGRMSNSHISGDKEKSIVSRGLTNFWTLNRLFDVLNIEYDNVRDEETDYSDYVDLTYAGFTFDKLENLLYK